jgi:hypothetical protein
MADRIRVEFLEDGRIKSTTDEISGPNHTTAEKFFEELARMTGGSVERSRRTDKHGVAHSHQHGEHTHEH